MMRQDRIVRGWTLKQVAQQIGVTPSAVHDIETERCRPSYDVLVKLLDLFGYDDPRKLFDAATPERQKEPDGNPAEPMM
jgi:transcriptional regulator with XRE-family HTH domain